jgi:hypothetical protein
MPTVMLKRGGPRRRRGRDPCDQGLLRERSGRWAVLGAPRRRECRHHQRCCPSTVIFAWDAPVRPTLASPAAGAVGGFASRRRSCSHGNRSVTTQPVALSRRDFGERIRGPRSGCGTTVAAISIDDVCPSRNVRARDGSTARRCSGQIRRGTSSDRSLGLRVRPLCFQFQRRMVRSDAWMHGLRYFPNPPGYTFSSFWSRCCPPCTPSQHAVSSN